MWWWWWWWWWCGDTGGGYCVLASGTRTTPGGCGACGLRRRARRRRRVGGGGAALHLRQAGEPAAGAGAHARRRPAAGGGAGAHAAAALLRHPARGLLGLRMVPPHLLQRVAATFDDATETCLDKRETVCSRGGARRRAVWRRALKQARLPVRLGGLYRADERGGARGTALRYYTVKARVAVGQQPAAQGAQRQRASRAYVHRVLANVVY